MEGQMLSLFDDEEYKVPQAPKKKAKEPLKEVPETEMEASEAEASPIVELLPEPIETNNEEAEESVEITENEVVAESNLDEITIEDESVVSEEEIEELPAAVEVTDNETITEPTVNTNAHNIAIELPDTTPNAVIEDIEITAPITETLPEETSSNALDALYHTAITEQDYFSSLTAIPQNAVEAPTETNIIEDNISAENVEIEPFVEEELVSGNMNSTADINEDPLPEWKLENKYYPIGEVAALFNVNTSHIRFWTTEFKLKTRTTRKGDRLYNPNDIEQLRLIYDLVKVKKYTLKGAKEKLKNNKDGVASSITLKESLLSLKSSLTEILKKLD